MLDLRLHATPTGLGREQAWQSCTTEGGDRKHQESHREHGPRARLTLGNLAVEHGIMVARASSMDVVDLPAWS